MRVSFVTSELLGAHKNGGIGTSTAHLAVLLAQNGHQVTIIHTGAGRLERRHPWTERYVALGIEVVRVDWRDLDLWPKYLRESSATLEYLSTRENDLIVFADWEGPAYASILARRAGLAFHNTKIAVIAHGPTEWLIEANRRTITDLTPLAQVEMERTAFEYADAVVSPSGYLMRWLEAKGYALPSNAQVMPLYLWSDEGGSDPPIRGSDLAKVSSFAFFGRLEERKGVRLFIEAITSPLLDWQDFDVHFVGKPATLSIEEVRALVGERRPWLRDRLHFWPDFDAEEAQSFLIRESCLAVIPSLTDNSPCVVVECLRRGIPFLASKVGGIPELVDPADQERILFEPKPAALAGKLRSALDQGFALGQLRHHKEPVGGAWLSWVEGLAPSPPPPEARRGERPARDHGPAASVIVSHYERPHLLAQNVAALALQTRTDFELIIVDDGSASAAAREGLAAIEEQRWPFPLKIHRQANAYLGAARNAGVKQAATDLLIFMDDDNIAFPPMIEALLTAQERFDADIVTSQMLIFREPTGEPNLDLLAAGERWGFTAGPAELGLSVNCFGDATGIYRRSVFERIGGFHEWHGVGHEDWHLFARAKLAGLRLISLPTPLFWYRRVEGSMLHTTDQFKNNQIIWDVYKNHLPLNLRYLADLGIRNPFAS